MKKLLCFRCGHEWTPRIEIRPLSCPKCKSRTWDIIGYTKCEICRRSFFRIVKHHKDGNRLNNEKGNVMKICNSCHQVIHQGFPKVTRRDRNYGNWKKSKGELNTRRKLEELRKLWLKFKVKGGK